MPFLNQRRRTRLALALAATLAVLSGCSATPEPDRSEAASTGETSTSGGSVPADSQPSAPASGRRYVALGDSFTAAPLVPVTDVADGCFRSSSNYPSLVARELGLTLEDRSCGGATTGHLRRAQYPGVEPQLTAVTADTEVVSLGIGGNDGRVFGRLVGSCTELARGTGTDSPCQRVLTDGGRDQLLRTIRKTQPRLVAAVREIRRRAPQAEVLLVGYPQIVDPDNACKLLPLDPGDYDFAARANKELTDVVARAARITGATYVDVWTASRGHDICSDDPWINGSVTDQKRAARYHPFAEEQRAVADLVVDLLEKDS